MVAAFKSERGPLSNRNAWPLCVGIRSSESLTDGCSAGYKGAWNNEVQRFVTYSTACCRAYRAADGLTSIRIIAFVSEEVITTMDDISCSPFPRKDGAQHVALQIRSCARAYRDTHPVDDDLAPFLHSFSQLRLEGLGRGTNNVLPHAVKQGLISACRGLRVEEEPRYLLDGPEPVCKSADLAIVGQGGKQVIIEIKADGQYQPLSAGLSELRMLTGADVSRRGATVRSYDVLPVLLCVRDSGPTARAWERRLIELLFQNHNGPRPICLPLFAGTRGTMTFNASGVGTLLATIRRWLPPGTATALAA